MKKTKKFIANWLPIVGGLTVGFGVPIPRFYPGWYLVLIAGIAMSTFAYYASVVWRWNKNN